MLAIAAAAACGGNETNGGAAPAATSSTTHPPQMPPVGSGAPHPGLSPDGGAPTFVAVKLVSVSEAEVIDVLHAVNTSAIQEGQLAEAKASDPRVKAFAMQMVQAHTEGELVLAPLEEGATATTPPWTPGRPPPVHSVAAGVRLDAMLALVALGGEAGTSFDRAYLARQVAVNAAALALIEHALGSSTPPAAAPLPALETYRASTTANLTAALVLQSQLASGTLAPLDGGTESGAR
jgi:hypothetical protein